MRLLAAQPNVVSKLSGLGTFIHRNDPEHIAWIVRETVALFGADRCLFGSNFPIEKLWTDYASLIAAFRAAVAGFTPAEQAAMLHDTAARVYRLVTMRVRACEARACPRSHLSIEGWAFPASPKVPGGAASSDNTNLLILQVATPRSGEPRRTHGDCVTVVGSRRRARLRCAWADDSRCHPCPSTGCGR